MVNRWVGPFHSPNQAALELCLVLILLVGGIYASQLIRHQKMKLGVLVLLWSGTLPVVMLLCATRSRAGWLALVFAMAVIWVWNRHKWKTPCVIVFLLVLGICFWPGSFERALRVPSDIVVGERSILWLSTLALIHDHPTMGVGELYPTLLDGWYLPQTLAGRFYTPLNDGLSIASRFGLPVLGLSIALIAFVVASAWQQKRAFAGALAVACIGVHIVAGQFQAHLWTTVTFVSALLAVAAAGIIGRSRFTFRRLGIACLVGLCGVLLVAVAAWWASLGSRWRTALEVPDVVRIIPRQHADGKPMLVLVDSEKAKRRFREEVLDRARNPRFPLVVSLPRELTDWQQYRAIVAWNASGTELWSAARQGSVRGTIIIVDPHGLPDVASISQPVTVLLCDGSAFVPDASEVREAIARDAPLSSSIRVARNTSVWDVIEAQLSSLP